jgi:Ca2+-binding RTX toxin-like protein
MNTDAINPKRAVTAIGCLMLLSLAWPAASAANHVSITASVGARLTERVSSSSWKVEVSWDATCQGAGAGGASYKGDLYLIDVETAEEIYLGGVFGTPGQVDQLVGAKNRWQRLAPLLKIGCLSNSDLHGSGTAEFRGPDVLIPPRFGGGGGGSGGGGGGSGGSGGGDPTEPLHSGGCIEVLMGTNETDKLTGDGRGDVIFGLEGDDHVQGRGGHDCLLGGPGRDLLEGEDGYDRLTGSSGGDVLVGGPGINGYDAGSGRDFVNARNGQRELVRCGSGRDRARVDRHDRVRGCERVKRSD